MLFTVVLIMLGAPLLVLIGLAVRGRTPLSAALAFGGLLCLGVSLLAGPRLPEPRTAEAASSTVENFGEARFKGISDKYPILLGAALGPATQYNGVLSQWFKFSRVEYQPNSSVSEMHPDFPNLVLAPTGQETLSRQANPVPRSPNAQVAPILQKYLDGRARSDFYKRDEPEQDSEVLRTLGTFRDQYKAHLGSGIGSVVVYKGLPAQWTEYGRIEWHPEYDRSLLPGFPKIQLGRLGAEYLEQQGRKPDSQPLAAPLLAQWMSQQASGGANIEYMYGNAITSPVQDLTAGTTTQFYERAVFRWRTGASDIDEIRRLQVGQLLFYNNQVDRGSSMDEATARAAFIRFFFGDVLTEPVPEKSGWTVQYLQNSAFRWPSDSNDPSTVEALPLARDLYIAQLGDPPKPDIWQNPIRGISVGFSAAVLAIATALYLGMKQTGYVYR